MKFIIRSVLYLLITLATLAVLLLGVAWFGLQATLQDQPRLTDFPKASLEDLQRIKVLVQQASSQSTSEDPQSITLTERDLNLGISHFGPTQVKIPTSSYLAVDLDQSLGHISATTPFYVLQQYAEDHLALPGLQQKKAWQWFKNINKDKWINIHWSISIDSSQKKNHWIKPGKISIGDLTLSQSISEKIIEKSYAEFLKQKQAKIALDTWSNITDLQINNTLLTIHYRLPKSTQALASYQSLILSNDEQTTINHYSQLLRSLPKSGPLAQTVAPLFKQAMERANQSLDPIAENRAALLALSKAYGGDKLLQMLGNTTPNRVFNTPKPYTIYKRKDLAQHYILSAGLALVADENVASLIGLDKEIADLAQGKTISAWDLLADKAGARLAENATRSAKSARHIQRTLSQARNDKDLLPDLGAEFEFSDDRFSIEEVADLELLIELYLEQHTLLRK